jgi:hypothetical protein
MADGNRRSSISAEDYALALDDRPAALMTRPVVPRERADRDVDETIAHYLTEAGEEAPASLTCRLLTPAAKSACDRSRPVVVTRQFSKAAVRN